MNGFERDQSVERLLRQSLQPPRRTGVTDACLDAETLAAWVDGGLAGAALEGVQFHVADCARCQSLVGALTRANSVLPAATPERVRRRWLTWLAPLAAAAAAVAVWVAVPRDTTAPLPSPTEARSPSVERKAQESAPLVDSRQAPVPPKEERQARASREDTRPPLSAASGELAKKEVSKELRLGAGRLEADSQGKSQASSDATAASASAAAAPVAARRAFALARVEIASPDPMTRWRATGSVVERSTNGGVSWDPVSTGSAVEITAGAAPSALVCWLVGRGGMVLLSTDGRTWRRLEFPDMTDLSSVRATDARTASVSTVDGRMFSTADGGATWAR